MKIGGVDEFAESAGAFAGSSGFGGFVKDVENTGSERYTMTSFCYNMRAMLFTDTDWSKVNIEKVPAKVFSRLKSVIPGGKHATEKCAALADAGTCETDPEKMRNECESIECNLFDWFVSIG